MPFCPSCGYEFREDVTVCPDCDVELEDFPPEPEKDFDLFEEVPQEPRDTTWVPVYRAPNELVGQDLLAILGEHGISVTIRQIQEKVSHATKYNIRSHDFWGELIVPSNQAQKALTLITKYLDFAETDRRSTGNDFLPQQIIRGRMPHVNI